MAKMSIVVPVYNVEREITRCIDSLINQTFSNIEIIIVDDGSPDDCPRICDDYANKDHRVKVIHKKNGGSSDARNYGLKETTGEYVLFVDSDDEIELDACEKIAEYIDNGIDIIVGDAIEINAGEKKELRHSNLESGIIYTAKDYITLSIKAMEWYVPCWLNAYRREFLMNNQIYFVKGLLSEDLEYMTRVFLHANSIIYMNKQFYRYYIREASISHSGKTETNRRDLMYIYNLWMERFSQVEDENLRRLLYGYLIKCFLYTCRLYNITDKSDLLVSGLKKHFICKYSLNYVEKIKAYIYCINRKLYCKL